MENKIILIDVETTGVEDSDRIVQVAYKIMNSGESFVEYFNPEMDISIDAMSICHITNDMVRNKQKFRNSKMFEYLNTVKDSIFVAHNAKFDMSFLEREGIKKRPNICTLKLAHDFDKKSIFDKYNLQFLRYSLDLKFKEEIIPHDALSDVLVLEGLFKYLSKEGNYSIGQMIEISKEPIILKKIPFGKHKGQFFKNIPIDYLIWMRKQVNLEENLKATLDFNIKKYNV